MYDYPTWESDFSHYVRRDYLVYVIPCLNLIAVRRRNKLTCFDYSRKNYFRFKALLGHPIFHSKYIVWGGRKHGLPYRIWEEDEFTMGAQKIMDACGPILLVNMFAFLKKHLHAPQN